MSARHPVGSASPPRVVLLDRDGVLNVDLPRSVRCVEDLVLLPGAARAVARLGALGYLVAVVTNQSSVGRGWLAQAGLDAIHAALVAEIGREGGSIVRFFVCTHTPEAGCGCRKPRPGLLVEAAGALGFEPAATYFVGDDQRDFEAALAAGCRPALVRTGKGAAIEPPAAIPVFEDLADFVERGLSGAGEAR